VVLTVATVTSDIVEIIAALQVAYTDTITTAAAASTYIAKALTTTTGDIIYASAANTPARLGIGTTGQVLNVAGGVPAWATLGSGKVVQIVTATYATEVNNATTTYVDTGLTATITPTSASNKVLVFVSQNGVAKTASTASSAVGLQLLRAGTSILIFANYAGLTTAAVSNNVGTVGCEYLDSPATTSATIYKTQFKNNINASGAVVQEYNISSTIVLMEVTP
jgi:hypothetical protein